MRGSHPFYLQCGATLKHFYANNVEKDRIKISSSLDERNKYEYYLEPFRKAVTEGGAEAVMTAYNEINGVPAIVNGEVQRLVKDTWGLPGHVVCDGGDFSQTVNDHKYFESHAETLAYGLKAGVDCFTDDWKVVYAAAREALEKGLITETDITYHSGLSKIRLLCNGRYIGIDKATSADDTGRLKLCKPEEAETFIFTDWGFGSTTLFAESVGKFVTLEEGSIAEDTNEMGEGTEAVKITERVRAVKEEAFGWFIREAWNFKPVEQVSVEETKTEGEQTGKTQEAGETGKECLEGLLGEFILESWNGKEIGINNMGYIVPADAEDSDGYQKALFCMEIMEDGITEAQKLAENAEKTVVVIGCNPVINSKEEVDRTTLALPPAQERLVKKVQEANPDTIVVLLTNYPYAMGEIHKGVPAILCLASGSQEMGNGIGAALSGEAVPAGRLPMTWYFSDADLPDMNDYDIINGKRTYQYFEKDVLYPFGYGLSYTEFFYGAMEVSLLADGVKVSVQVKNVGNVKADEVVQLYVHKETSRVKQPISSLKGFERVKGIEPGENRMVTFKVKYEDLTYYDVISRKMLLEEGVYTFMAGASSKDIRQSVSVKLQGGKTGALEKVPVGKAPDRDPFVKTEGIQYDAYENCLIYRGEKKHTITGVTCVAPKENNKKAGVIYRDFLFEREPKEVCLKICAVSAGTVSLSCTGEKTGAVYRIPVEKSRDLEFIQIKCALPDHFVTIQEKQTLEIVLEGKIKLAYFVFL